MRMFVAFVPQALVSWLFITTAVCTVPDAQVTRIRNDIAISKIAATCFVYTSFFDLPGYGNVPAYGLVYILDRNACIVDSPWNDDQADALASWIEYNMSVTVAGVIVTHWHTDCMGGLRGLHDRGIPSYSFEGTQVIARQRGLPVPENGFGDSLRLGAEDRPLVCRYLGAGHTADNSVA